MWSHSAALIILVGLYATCPSSVHAVTEKAMSERSWCNGNNISLSYSEPPKIFFQDLNVAPPFRIGCFTATCAQFYPFPTIWNYFMIRHCNWISIHSKTQQCIIQFITWLRTVTQTRRQLWCLRFNTGCTKVSEQILQMSHRIKRPNHTQFN